jgi:hypothetical protein
LVYVSDPEGDLVTLGEFVAVRIEEAKTYDLFGVAVRQMERGFELKDMAPLVMA